MGNFANVPVAIVGADCRMPGANSLDEYWKLIVEGRSAVTTVPEDRLDRSLYFSENKGQLGRSYSELGGIVEENPFDAAALPIPESLRKNSDPVHLRMLEVCASALKRAGYDPLKPIQDKTGVYIGHSGGSCLAGDMGLGIYAAEVANLLRDDSAFADLPAETRDRVARELTDSIREQMPRRSKEFSPNFAAHDVAVLVNRALKLNGPACAIDAACASSLIAIAQAVLALQQGNIDVAIAGGCSYSKWYGMVLFSQAQSISGTGTRPFDKDADGLISSDGYAAIILKTLPAALEAGDPILGVVRNFCVASDGKGKSLWAPRREGQVGAVRAAYHGTVTPDTLQYIECHATSTQVGDATEITALAEALGPQLPAGHKLPIGSVKGNVGHTLECAGIAGMLKVLLALKHGVIPPQPNLNQLNPEIPWERVPFTVPTTAQPWPAPNQQGVRRAAVNAFGIGGLNSHFVIDDRPEPSLLAEYGPKPQSHGPSPTASNVTRRSRPATSREPIAIVGMGAVVPDAFSLDEFWSLVSSGRSALSEAPADRWTKELYLGAPGQPYSIHGAIGGVIRGYEFDWKKHRVPPKQIANANPLQFMLLDAADQAFRDSGLFEKTFNRARTSVVVGTVFGGDFSCQMQMGLRIPHLQRELRKSLQRAGFDAKTCDDVCQRYADHLLKKMPALQDETGSFTSSTLASRLTKTFDLMGGAWAIDGSDASSLLALQTGMDLLRAGHSELVMCAAGQRTMDVTIFEGLSVENALAHGNVRPPYDAEQQGFVPGEGVGVVLLKKLSDARRDGDRIRGVIRDISFAFDESCSPSAASKNIRRALQLSDEDQNVSEPVDFIEIARPQVAGIDEVELKSFEKGLASTSEKPAVIASLNGQIGHTQGASGMLSLIKAALEIEQGVVPTSAGAQQPIPEIAAPSSAFRFSHIPARLGNGQVTEPRRSLIANVAGNGLLGHLVLENLASVDAPRPRVRMPEPSKAAPSKKSVVRLGASSLSELEARIDALVSSGRVEDNGSFTANEPLRLAAVGNDTADLLKKLQSARKMASDLPRRQVLADMGLYIAETSPARGKTAVLFSGQGAQYTGMLRDWVDHSPRLRERMTDLNGHLKSLGLPTVEFLCWDEAAGLGTHVLNTQLAILIGDLLAWEVLQECGTIPDVIAGHSYGEFPALVAAGAWSARDAIIATIARTNAVENCRIGSAEMLSTSAPAVAVQELINAAGLPLDIACINAPTQTIIAGLTEDIRRLEADLKSAGHASRPIRVPKPYHSRLMQPAKAPLAAELERLEIRAPQVPFISCGSLAQITTPAEVRRTLVEQLTEPVRYSELVEKLIAEGVDLLVESGPRQILTRLNRQIVGPRPVGQICVDGRPREAAEQEIRLQLMRECFSRQSQPVSSATPANLTKTTHASTAVASRYESENAAKTAQLPAGRESQMEKDQPSVRPGQIIWFDATEVRRQKMREASRQKLQSRFSEDRPSTSGPAPTHENGHAYENGHRYENGHHHEGANGNGHGNGHSRLPQGQTGRENGHSGARHVSPSPAPVTSNVTTQIPAQSGAQPQPSTPAPASAPSSGSAPSAVRSEGDAVHLHDKLEQFVLDFVVEQTGYPPELVELDANLEADLGIDSIRKAQLLGEVAETFGLKDQAMRISDMSLDDLPTLRTIVNFFAEVGSESDSVATSVVAEAAAPAPTPTPVAAPAPTAAEPTPAALPSVSRDEMTQFAVSYVIEQTGYPEELVELEANLEADLGIDSIRKAQLLGEIAEHFQMQSVSQFIGEMSLDDLPTLQSIIDFFLSHSSSEASTTSAPQTTAAPPPATASPPPTASAPVSSAAQQPAAAESATATLPESSGLDRQEVETFLVNFVIEETGYPEELVEMDANLEADLGIDSIRKARLMGEVAEHFRMEGLASLAGEMSLDDFPTLQSVADFFCERAGDAKSPATATLTAPPAPAPTHTGEASTATPTNETPSTATVPASTQHGEETESSSVTSAPPPKSSAQIDRRDVEEFAIAFVIEQTGYPEELVELDANLEADLGIDSIRKAQLLGEVAEHFGLVEVATRVSDMSLDDLPTLASIVDFFCDLDGGSDASAVPTQPPAATESAVQQTAPQPAFEAALQLDTVPEADRTMRRYILRRVAEPLAPNSDFAQSTPFAGHVVILGTSSLAESLKSDLQTRRSTVRVVETGSDWRQSVAQFEQIHQQQPVDHLIVLTSDHASEERAWTEVRDRELLVPYFVIQRWIQLRLESGQQPATPSVLCAVTRMGGDFALSGRVGSIAGGALTGLFKGIRREYPQLIVKVMDAACEEPGKVLAQALHDEVAASVRLLGTDQAKSDPVEVGILRGQRHRLRMIARPASTLPKRTESRAGAWVVTGGARGITARVAKGIGQIPGVKLQLLGRSAAPDVPAEYRNLDEQGLAELKKSVMREAAANKQKPIDVWNSLSRAIDLDRSLAELRSAGLDITYHSCDVSNRDAVAAVLQNIRRDCGPIRGIIHGAGVENAARFDRKKPESVEATVTSKVDGAQWLWELTADDPLTTFVAFGSTSGRFGGMGQTDYSMSSDLLCKMCSNYAALRPDCRVIAVHWPPWAEIGMAARPESKFALEASGLSFLPPAEGVSHLLDEILAAARETEVAFIDEVWDVSPEETAWDRSLVQEVARRKEQLASSAYVDGIVDASPNHLTIETTFDPTRDDILVDHQLREGIPLVPGAVMLELCARAAALLAGNESIGPVQDFEIFHGIRFHGEASKTVLTTAVRNDRGEIECQVKGPFVDQKGRIVELSRTYASARVMTMPSGTAATSENVPVPGQWTELESATSLAEFDPLHVGSVYHGPALNSLAGIQIVSDDEAWFRLDLSRCSQAARNRMQRELTAPIVTDAILQATDVLRHRTHGTEQLPQQIGQVQLDIARVRQLGEVLLRHRICQADREAVVATTEILDSQGRRIGLVENARVVTRKSGQPAASTASSKTPTSQVPARPLLSRASVKRTGNELQVEWTCDPNADPFLKHHRLNGNSILPAVMGVEMMAECAEFLGDGSVSPVEIRDFRVHSGVQFPGGRERTLRVRCTREGNLVSCEMFESEQAKQPSMLGTVVLGTPGELDVAPLRTPKYYSDFVYRQDIEIVHGPPFHGLQRIASHRYVGWAELRRPEAPLLGTSHETMNWIIEPALLDGALVGCGVDCWVWTGGAVAIPAGFGRIRLSPPRPQGQPQSAVGQLRALDDLDDDETELQSRYDFTLFDESGQAFLQVEDFVMSRLDRPASDK